MQNLDFAKTMRILFWRQHSYATPQTRLHKHSSREPMKSQGMITSSPKSISKYKNHESKTFVYSKKL